MDEGHAQRRARAEMHPLDRLTLERDVGVGAVVPEVEARAIILALARQPERQPRAETYDVELAFDLEPALAEGGLPCLLYTSPSPRD